MLSKNFIEKSLVGVHTTPHTDPGGKCRLDNHFKNRYEQRVI